jgi:pullulanase/glycogen debranching enzyme
MSQTGDFSSDTLYNGACTYLGENRNVSSSVATRPEQTVNYVSCHDNYTLYDQLNYCRDGGNDADVDHEDVMRSAVATSAFVLMSQGIAFIQGGEEIFRQKLMKSDDPYWDKIEAGDYYTCPSGNRLIRNSYAYGDAVNSFKWERKASYETYFQQYAAACQERATLLKEGYLGVSYDLIQGTYGSGTKVSRLWDDMWDASATPHRSVIAAQTEFSKASGSTLKDFYVILGGRMSGASQSLGIGSGNCEVLYDSTGNLSTGSTLTIDNNAMDVAYYQCLVLRRLS